MIHSSTEIGELRLLCYVGVRSDLSDNSSVNEARDAPRQSGGRVPEGRLQNELFFQPGGADRSTRPRGTVMNSPYETPRGLNLLQSHPRRSSLLACTFKVVGHAYREPRN